MASPSWFNENENRAYPFTLGENNPARTLVVDAGFVMGAKSRFGSGTNIVQLVAVRRSGSFFYLDFVSDAPELFGVLLTFSRSISDDDFATEFVDSGTAGLSASSDSKSGSQSHSDSISTRLCDEPLWSGFVVTGRMSKFLEILPTDGTLSYLAKVEPGLIQNLSAAYVSQISVANVDRTTISAAPGCDGPPDSTDEILHVNATCIIGDVVFVPGFNTTVTQNLTDNSITLGAVVGAGAGEPCEPVKTYPQETVPSDSSLLEGGPKCNETLRSVNGVGGPLLTLIAGNGITITSMPSENRLIVNANMTGLALCFDSISHRSESC